jgi:type II secretory pathway component PulJ
MFQASDRPRKDAGLTFAELMVVVTLLSLVISVVYMVLTTTAGVTNRTEARGIAGDEVRTAMERIRMDLRQGEDMTDYDTGQPLGVFVTASPRECVFYADTNRDDSLERVRYFVSGQTLYRETASAVTTPAASNSSWRAYSGRKALLKHLDSTWSGPIFVYKSTGTTPVTFSSANALISVLDVEIRDVVRSATSTASVASKGTVTVRTEIQY